jgi:hypothetical protein
MGLRLVFNRVTLERSIPLVPDARPVKVRIVSGMKKVAPTVGRKDPLTIETDEMVPGAKLRSN